MSWVFVALLACAVAVVVAAEWPRLSKHLGGERRLRRQRSRRKATLTVVRSERDEFAASVQRDLDALPTTHEHEHR